MKALRRVLTSSGLFHSPTKFDAEHELDRAVLHVDAHDEGGLACNDDALLAEMRACIMAWIKSMGRQLLAGNLNLVNTSFPVRMFEPRSYLEKLADAWAQPVLLNAAAAAADPLERMKLLVAWLVAGLHYSLEASWRKPFNPILGETWQASLSGGINVWLEQISHHPPVSAYQMTGPGWEMNGWSQPAVVPVVRWYGIRTAARGARRLRFADGTSIEITMPSYAIKGVVYAARPHAEVLGVARLLDETNRLEAIVSFGPVPGTSRRVLSRADTVAGEVYRLPRAAHLAAGPGVAGGALQRSSTCATAMEDLAGSSAVEQQLAALSVDGSDGGGDDDTAGDEAIFNNFNKQHFGGSPNDDVAVPPSQPPPSPALAAGRHHPTPGRSKTGLGLTRPVALSSDGSRRGTACAAVPGVAVARIEGCWLSHLNIDNQRVWTLADSVPQRWQPDAAPLPSDSRYREDLAALAAGDLAGAQEWKGVLEERQRADKRARAAAGVREHE